VTKKQGRVGKGAADIRGSVARHLDTVRLSRELGQLLLLPALRLLLGHLTLRLDLFAERLALRLELLLAQIRLLKTAEALLLLLLLARLLLSTKGLAMLAQLLLLLSELGELVLAAKAFMIRSQREGVKAKMTGTI